MVAIELLGLLQVKVGDEIVELPPSKRTRALLAYLVLSKNAVSREALCNLLWADSADARGSLRWSLTKLRGVLGDDALDANRDNVALEGVTTDLAAVDAALVAEGGHLDTLLAAQRTFRGEMLSGLELPECNAYHAWWRN